MSDQKGYEIMTDAEIKQMFTDAKKVLMVGFKIVGDPELSQVLARAMRTMFQAFVNEGFTTDQAMALTISYCSKMSDRK